MENLLQFCNVKLHFFLTFHFLQTQLLLLISGMNLDTSLGLKCYNCTTRWEFDACVLHPNQTNFITCETHQNVCMVWGHQFAWMLIYNDIRLVSRQYQEILKRITAVSFRTNFNVPKYEHVQCHVKFSSY